MDDSWLDEPVDGADDDWLEDPIPVEELQLVPRTASEIEIPLDAEKCNQLVLEVWGRLDVRKQRMLQQLKASHFNTLDACRVLKAQGDTVHRATARRWAEGDEDYKFLLKFLKAREAGTVIDRDRLLLRADEIAERAMEGHAVLSKDGKVVGTKRQLDVALRANEQLMKTQKMLGNEDEHRGRVAEGPALVIQIVQKDGGLVDVTPRGVTIELPAPDGAAA